MEGNITATGYPDGRGAVTLAGVERVVTTGTTQTMLFVAAAAATVALMLATLVDLAGNRARDKAREEFRARYGEYPS